MLVIAQIAPGLKTEDHIERLGAQDIGRDVLGQVRVDGFALQLQGPAVILHQVGRLQPFHLCGQAIGHHPLEHLGPAFGNLHQPVLPGIAGGRLADDGKNARLDVLAHFAEQGVHVLKVPEHGAQAHSGHFGNARRAGRKVTLAHQFQHRRDDPGAA